MKLTLTKQKITATGLSLLLAAGLGMHSLARGKNRPLANLSLSATGMATIDGTLNADEWGGAASTPVNINLPALQGGGTALGTLYIMNDATNLYLALKIPQAEIVTSSFSMEFDQNNNGLIEPGDDGFVLNTSPYGPPTMYDVYRYSCFDGSALCSGLDDANGGTIDGTVAVVNSGGYTVYEIARPLNSNDDAHDFSLNPGDAIGFTSFYRMIVGEYPAGFGDTTFPLGGTAEIVIANSVIPVAIDINPNTIRLGLSGSRVKVAVLTTPSFNAETEVNPSSIRFGKDGNNALPILGQSKKEDIDGDGDLDWSFQFTVASTGISCGTTAGKLTGRTLGGTRIEGVNSIRTICR